MEPAVSFGYWLRRRRKALDLTQAELAQRVGCATGTIKHIEADERRPSRQMAARLAECLRIPPEEHAAFISAARAELSPDRLLRTTQPLQRAEESTVPRSERQPLPSGTVTFLFTDVEGSTRLWEQHQEAMHQALARHDAILRQAIAAHSGHMFKTMGDAVYAAFASAPDALSAALAAQRALLIEDWGKVGALRVRMALHTGTAQAYAGDYIGLPLNRVARLLSAGHGGQILLSRATQELLRDDLPPDLELRDLGQHQLKDLIRPEHLYQLVAPDLPANFPPLRTLDRHITNLPAQPTALIGREREVSSVRDILRRASMRLVTLTGPGGTGKTRLALQVASELLDEFAHGVWFVNLAPIGDPALVIATIAQVLGLKESGSQSFVESLKAYLHEKQLL
ncbi:MAG: helix-turn-helix domain-containing protein, partial [Roseiflexaceae bacterium]